LAERERINGRIQEILDQQANPGHQSRFGGVKAYRFAAEMQRGPANEASANGALGFMPTAVSSVAKLADAAEVIGKQPMALQCGFCSSEGPRRKTQRRFSLCRSIY
jgi:hypothetical protein